LLGISYVFVVAAYIKVRNFFEGRNNLQKKCLLPQLNVFSIKGAGGTLVISVKYWRSCTGSRNCCWTVVYLSGIVRCAHLLSVSPFASHCKILQSMRKGKKRKRKSLVNTESRKQKFTPPTKLAITQEWTKFYWHNFNKRLIKLFDISVWHFGCNWHKAVYFVPVSCLMTLHTERSNAHFTVAFDCTLYFSAGSNCKDADLWKRKATEFHLFAAQKFLSKFTALS
jgi:hypothetical protein